MRAFLFAFLILALGCTPPAAQPSSAASGPALWRIADGDSEIWLFGTVHLLPANVQWRSPQVETAFAAAQEFVTETDTSPAGVAEFQRLSAELGAMPAGENMLDDLSAGARARFDRIARGANFDPRQFETVRPWLAAMQLSYFHAVARGHSSEAGVETVLAADAQAQGKRHTFLETPAQQIHILADLSHADQIRFLEATLRQIEEESDTLESLDQAWARGELDDLGEQLDAQIGEAGPAVHRALIIDRNRAWADEIARRLEGEGRVFIAVGAAHLVGEHSVVAILRQRGIPVEGP